MREHKVLLEKIHIRNFLSLRDVILPLKPLTVLVGPNGSGKSNSLISMNVLKKMIYAEMPPSADFIQNVTWVGGANKVVFHLEVKINETPATYKLELKAERKEEQIALEELIVNEIKVISVRNGQGEVKDENDNNVTKYRPSKPKLALKSASDYGDKPKTAALTEFIRGWEFYNFQPDVMRGRNGFTIVLGNPEIHAGHPKLPPLNHDGSTLKDILSYWSENDEERFQSVNESLENCIKRRIEYHTTGGSDGELCLWEGYPVSLRRASDGTMRLLAYQVLLNHPDLPPLIAIEEPERNLHPAIFKEIVGVLEQLAERTQVIITTHSSQLLDAFNSEGLGVLLLQNVPEEGTKVINLEETRKDRKALDGWITDFGIGSAIFDSELLQDIMEG